MSIFSNSEILTAVQAAEIAASNAARVAITGMSNALQTALNQHDHANRNTNAPFATGLFGNSSTADLASSFDNTASLTV